MPIRLEDIPLEQLPVELSRSLEYNNPSILNYADKVNDSSGLPKGLMRSIIANGERSGSLSTSPKGAQGVGQFIPETAKKYGLADPTDPKASIEAMSKYLLNARQVTGSSDPAILAAAYNSGENRKELKEGKIPNIPETQAYAKRVSGGVSPPPKGLTLEEAMAKAGLEKGQPSSLLNSVNPNKPEIKTSAAEAAGKAAIEGVIPAVAGLAAFGSGAAAGATLTAPIAAALAATGVGAVVAPVVEAIGTIGGGLAASFGVGYLTQNAQNYLVNSLPEGVLKAIGMDKETRAAENEQHPVASFVGGAAASVVGFKPGYATMKQVVANAGFGGAVEAGHELYQDGQLDPLKIGLATGLAAGMGKTNRVGAAILEKTAVKPWTPLAKVTPKDDYVKSVVEAAGPKYKEAAEQLWDKVDSKTHPKAGLVVKKGETTSKHVEQLSDAQFALAANRDVDKLQMTEYIKGMSPEEFNVAASEELYHTQPGERDAPVRGEDTVYRGTSKKWDEVARSDETEYWSPNKKHAETYAGKNGEVVSSRPNMKNPVVMDESKYNADSLESARINKNVDGVIVTRDGKPIVYASFGKASMGKVVRETASILLTPEQRYVQDRYLTPLRDENNQLRTRAAELGGEHFVPEEEFNSRILQATLINKVARIGDEALGQGGVANTAGTQKARSVYALEMENGTKRIINLNGRQVNGFDASKKATPIANLPTAPKLGDTIQTGIGKGKIVQATTAHIEAETNFKYNKNALVNELMTRAQLKSYIREKEWLQNTVAGLETMGHAIPKTETNHIPPKGFKAITGDNTLEKYFLRDRLAETFEDGLLKGSKGGLDASLGKINQVAIGTMFWNPIPHLQNAFSHYLASSGFDLVKPWQYKSLAKSAFESIRDVSTLSPDYQRYMESGMGLQYGRVQAGRVYENMLKGIPEASLADLAKEWSMHPTKLVEAIYSGAKNVLWGGSDIMMLSAYKHMASKKGESIFNQAIKNHVEAHNPNYRIPTRIGFDSMMKVPGMPEAVAKALSRNMSLVMQSKALNTFGRYHYGQFKSIGHDIHDVIRQNEKSVSTRGEALSHAAFLMFSATVVYPYMWDTIAKVVTGDDSAKARRSGADTIPYTVYHMVLGDETVGKLISEAFGFPPITKALIELPANRNLFTGQHIWEPEDNWLGKAADVGLYVTGAVASPVKSAQQMVKDPVKTVGGQVGIQTGVDKSEAQAAARKQRDTAAAKRRQKTRGYFEGGD